MFVFTWPTYFLSNRSQPLLCPVSLLENPSVLISSENIFLWGYWSDHYLRVGLVHRQFRVLTQIFILSLCFLITFHTPQWYWFLSLCRASVKLINLLFFDIPLFIATWLGLNFLWSTKSFLILLFAFYLYILLLRSTACFIKDKLSISLLRSPCYFGARGILLIPAFFLIGSFVNREEHQVGIH